MIDKPVQIAVDPVKVRLSELKRKPVLTPQEVKEMLDLLCKKAGVE